MNTDLLLRLLKSIKIVIFIFVSALGVSSQKLNAVTDNKDKDIK